jgi:hypothetical protein
MALGLACACSNRSPSPRPFLLLPTRDNSSLCGNMSGNPSNQAGGGSKIACVKGGATNPFYGGNLPKVGAALMLPAWLEATRPRRVSVLDSNRDGAKPQFWRQSAWSERAHT